ncbi:MAG: hypothetical protein JXX29_07980 [Deltaproteobacteria bacterium]|nr:hypothetical protein [Deltaproteobacteria bacterium]MBN2671597.1 hypothetical protein [Deltaproteobacteria bacterium]
MKYNHIMRCVRFVITVVITGCVFLGCNTDLPPIAWEGEKIRFATTEDHLPCGHALEVLDADVANMEEQLGLPLGGGVKITYYWLPNHMYLSPCDDWSSGCASGYTIYTTQSSHQHELVHILTSALGPGHAFLSEGFAEAFNQHSRFELSDEGNIKERIRRCLVSHATSVNIDYQLAGKFVRFLISEYGLKTIKNVYARIRPGSDAADYDQVFTGTLGDSLDTVIDQFVRTAPDCYATPGNCHDMAPPTQWENGVWEHRFTLSCAAAEKASGGETFQSVVVDVPTTGPYKLEVEGTFGFKLAIRLAPCSTVNENCYFTNIQAYAGEVRVAGLDQGRYEITAAGPNAETTFITLRLSEL